VGVSMDRQTTGDGSVDAMSDNSDNGRNSGNSGNGQGDGGEGVGRRAPWETMADWTEAEREWWRMGPFDGGVPGLVRRVRRILDVSQRGLAAMLGVSQSVVARWETGRTSPRVRVLHHLLQLAGVAVEATFTDTATGEVVEPMRADGARTRRGSRFPAHVDLEATTWWVPRRLAAATTMDYWTWLDRSRRDGDPAIGYRLTGHKWCQRSLHGIPDDHPAVHQFVAEVRWREEERERYLAAARTRHAA
jgi:transcriptional regulator with XRE-family HTH domain